MAGPPYLVVSDLVVVKDTRKVIEKCRRAEVGWQLSFATVKVQWCTIYYANSRGNLKRRWWHARCG